jgi:hypothetical protein
LTRLPQALNLSSRLWRPIFNKLFSKDEFLTNLAALVEWDRDFEVPDPLSFLDYTSFPELTHDIASANFAMPGAPVVFPYPNGVRKTRTITVLDGPLLATYRTVAGVVARTTDRLLSRCVLHERAAGSLPWRPASKKTAWTQFRSIVLDVLTPGRILLTSDVKSYYPSIAANKLLAVLRDAGVASAICAQLDDWLAALATAGLRGLPIGPPGSGVYGTYFLRALDEEILRQKQCAYGRFMDDFRVVVDDRCEAEAVVSASDVALQKVGLTRSIEKTAIIDDHKAARASVNSREISIAAALLKSDRGQASTRVREMFQESISDPARIALPQMRWSLQTMRNRGDRFAVKVLATRPDVIALEPKLCADYLRHTEPQVALVHLNESTLPPAAELHLLRACAIRRWGDAEESLFRQIADDCTKPAPTRAWAIQAWGGRGGLRLSAVEPYVVAVNDILIQRAALGTLRGQSPSRKLPTFLDAVKSSNPALRACAEWVATA